MSVLFADVVGQVALHLPLDLSPVVAEAGVVGIAFQLAQVFQVVEPAFADFFRIKGRPGGGC